MRSRAVFLDRDGTINEHREGYVTSWAQFRFLPNSLEALGKLDKTDYRIIIITNQSAVARGLMSQEDLESIHQRMLAQVEEAGGRIDAIFVCAHHPSDGCGCRKPKTGLVMLAKEAYDLDLGGSWFVGDNTKDIETGRNAGCKTILLKTGYGGKDGLHKGEPDRRAEDLLEATSIVAGR
jgi:D-glycero-D-manno-heptose 1,7-bisphosphate phosphatase